MKSAITSSDETLIALQQAYGFHNPAYAYQNIFSI